MCKLKTEKNSFYVCTKFLKETTIIYVMMISEATGENNIEFNVKNLMP